MLVKYGTYSHAAGEVEVQIAQDVLENDAGIPYAYRKRWELLGQLVADSEQQMNTRIAALLVAYSANNQNLTLQLTNGSSSEVSIAAATANGGVRVISGPNFPTGRAAAYVTFLPYTITLEAEVPIGDPISTLRSFDETLSRSGGGRRFGMLEPNVGYPIRQQLKQNTIYRVVQSGRAVGIYSRALPAAPLWPQWLVEAPEIIYSNPKRRGYGTSVSYQDYETRWSYTFESSVKLIGSPHVWGINY